MSFATRQISASLTLGQRLRQLRQDEKLSIDDVAKEINVAAKYIEAIENGQYDQLPGLVYARSFARRYAQFLQLQEDTAMERFDQEYKIISKTKGPARALPPERISTEHPWLRRHFRLVVAGLALVIVMSYVGWQAWRLFVPPKLIVTEPTGNIITKENQVRVSGETETNVFVAINSQSVTVSPSGQFSELIDVSTGQNILVVSAKKKNSHAREIRLVVLVEQ